MVDGNGTQRAIGTHEQAIRDIREDISSMNRKLDPIVSYIERQKGARIALWTLSGVISTVISLIIGWHPWKP